MTKPPHRSAPVSGTSKRPFSAANASSQTGEKCVTPALTTMASAGRSGRNAKPSTAKTVACGQARASFPGSGGQGDVDLDRGDPSGAADDLGEDGAVIAGAGADMDDMLTIAQLEMIVHA